MRGQKTLFILLLVSLVVAGKRGKGRLGLLNPKVETGSIFSGDAVANEASRRGKYFSLFNVVQFQNSACTSQQARSISTSATTTTTNTGTAANRAGTCFASSECTSKGGQASGSCASGFGICCVFTSNGGSITQNCTYLQNLGFPAALTGTSGVTYTINKCNNGVCAIRLDFETFMTLGPAGGTTEATGGVCQDTLTITASNNPTAFPVICGSNTGQHVYVSLGQNAANTAMLNFAFLGTAVRMWDIKATQVLCGVNDPPDGCFQYFTGTSGQIMTFNFAAAASTNLASQMYTACIRQAEGFCCVEYIPCPGVAGAFSINQETPNVPSIPIGMTDGKCSKDFIQISGASASCSATNVAMTSRICGSVFTTVNGINKFPTGSLDIPICDCSEPFNVGIVTDSVQDNFAALFQSRGVCLQYQQLPCSTNM